MSSAKDKAVARELKLAEARAADALAQAARVVESTAHCANIAGNTPEKVAAWQRLHKPANEQLLAFVLMHELSNDSCGLLNRMWASATDDGRFSSKDPPVSVRAPECVLCMPCARAVLRMTRSSASAHVGLGVMTQSQKLCAIALCV